MRPSIERVLRTYSLLDKEQLPAQDPANEPSWKDLLEQTFQAATQVLGTTDKAQRKIFELQRAKNALMRQLEEQLKRIRQGQPAFEIKPDTRWVTSENGQLIANHANGQRQPITLGMLATDADWDIEYALDHQTVPKRVQQRYAIEQTKRKLREYLNQQLYAYSLKNTVLPENYTGGFSGSPSTPEKRELQEGWIAEDVVKNYFLKLAFDKAATLRQHGIELSVEPADIQNDVMDKIDIILRLRISSSTDALAGVHTEESPSRRTIGVQLTVKKGGIGRKKRQIEEVQQHLNEENGFPLTLILVRLPELAGSKLYQTWKEKKSCGGPDELWSEPTKWTLLFKVLGQFIARDRLEALTRDLYPTKPVLETPPITAEKTEKPPPSRPPVEKPLPKRLPLPPAPETRRGLKVPELASALDELEAIYERTLFSRELSREKEEHLRTAKEYIKKTLGYLWDSPEDSSKFKSSKNRQFRWSKGQFTYRDSGAWKPISEADLLTDVSWDITYIPIKSDTPLDLLRIYFAELAKAKLRAAIRKEIAPISKKENRRLTAGDSAHLLDPANRETLPWPPEPLMVMNCLRKAIITDSLPVTLLRSDEHREIDPAAHFRLVVVNKTRDVRVVLGEANSDLRIEREFKPNEPRHGHILVTIPPNLGRDLLPAWQKTKPPGGLDALWSKELKDELVSNLIGRLI